MPEGWRVLVETTRKAVRSRRAVQNLVTNAVKYGGDSRWIRVEVLSADFADADAGARSARVTVRDSGPGIAREDLSRLFDPFYRTAEAKSSQIPGSGLGLSFVRHVAEAHGGRVEAKSRRGEGALFTIVLPLAPLAPLDREAAS